MSGYSLGIDFGTTNTVLSLADAEGPARLVKFAAPEGELFAFRSCISFHAPAENPQAREIAKQCVMDFLGVSIAATRYWMTSAMAIGWMRVYTQRGQIITGAPVCGRTIATSRSVAFQPTPAK